MKRLILLALLLWPAAALAQVAARPLAVSTLTTTDTTAASALIGCAVGTTTGCTGGIAAGPVVLTPAGSTSGSPSLFSLTGPADTTLAAGTEATDVLFNISRVVQFSTGALALQRAYRITSPTYAFAGASILTTAATLNIAGAPSAGTNATITNAIGLRMPTIVLGGTVTNGYGITIEAPSGASNNYAAAFTGAVGIGTTAPGKTLDVIGTMRVTGTIDATFVASYNAATSVLAYFEQSGTSHLLVNFQRTGGTTSTWQIQLPSGSTVFSLLNASVAQATWDTSGHYGVKTLASATSNTLCYDTTTISGLDTLTTCSSLRRLKDAITPMSLDTARTVLQFQPVTFLDKTSRELHAGLIADDVYAAAAGLGDNRNAFSTFYRGELNGIHYDGVTAALLKVVQDQEARIRKLEDKQ